MVFYTFEDVIRLLQTFQETPVEVSDELRGWRWREPPLLAPYKAKVNAADLSFGCDTGRLAYLRYVTKQKEKPDEKLLFGAAVHKSIVLATTTAKGILYRLKPRDGKMFYEEMKRAGEEMEKNSVSSNYVNVFRSLWNLATFTYSSALDRVLSISHHLSWDGVIYRVVPWICEFPIDGRLLGLNRAIRIDALITPNLIVEFKTRKPSRSYEIALAGYALCFESQFRTPVNHAVILYLSFDGKTFKVFEHFVTIDDALRLEFVERRDLYMKIASEGFDPGLPQHCDPYCPYLKVCGG